jgi:hypothetical protein
MVFNPMRDWKHGVMEKNGLGWSIGMLVSRIKNPLAGWCGETQMPL